MDMPGNSVTLKTTNMKKLTIVSYIQRGRGKKVRGYMYFFEGEIAAVKPGQCQGPVAWF